MGEATISFRMEKVGKKQSPYSFVGLAIELGFFISFTVLLFILGGFWLDKKLNTLPLFLLLGSFASIAVVMFEVYKILKLLSKS